jgi:ribosomal protein S18 acetylase RimI-like enzyme
MSVIAPSSSELQVRAALQQDAETLVWLMQEFYAESNHTPDPSWAKASFRTLLGSPALGRVWLAHLGATPVGYAVLTVRYSMEFGGLSGYIDDLFVKTAFRRRGAAHLLLSVLFAECRTRGCESVHVEVGGSNASALTLYAKFGLNPQADGRVLLSRALPAVGT